MAIPFFDGADQLMIMVIEAIILPAAEGE